MRIDAQALRAVVRYDPDSGAFTRLGRPSARATIGRDAKGYVRFMVNGTSARGHVWAWLYMTGTWPTKEIDHINGVRDDNRWDNLRHVSRLINAQNRQPISKVNSTGLLGAFRTPSGRYRAAIHHAGRTCWLGTFDTAADAHSAHLKAKRALHPGCTI